MIAAIAVILLFGVAQFDGQTLWSQIRLFRWSTIGFSLGAVMLQILFQTGRLWFLFPRSASLTWNKAAIAFIRGQFVGNWVSTQAGYAVKIWSVRPNSDHKRPQLSLLSVTAIILLDKLVDIAVLAVLSMAGLIWLWQTHAGPNPPVWAAIATPIDNFVSHLASHSTQGAALIVGFTLCLYGLKKFGKKRFQSWPQFQSLKQQLKTSLAFLKSPPQILGASLMGLGDWIFEMISLQILCTAQNFNLDFAQLTICLLILNLGISLPSGIANVGAFEASLTFALLQFGIPLNRGLAIAVIYHALQLAGISVWYLLINCWRQQPKLQPDLIHSPKKSKSS